MGVQLVASIFGSHTLSPILAGLLWPFLIKLSCGSRVVRETYIDLVHSSSLFFFQLRQIAVEAEQPTGAEASTSAGAGGGSSRWERALRLVYRSMTRARRSMQQTSVQDEESLHALSMLAL